MRVIAILNPRADNGKAGRMRAAVEAAMRAAGLGGEVWLTEAPGHAVALGFRMAITRGVDFGFWILDFGLV